MRDNPERLAWTVLLLAFATFCALVIGIPLSARSYVLNAMNAEPTSLTSVHGTVLALPRNASVPVPVTDGTTIKAEEGTLITTEANSQAVLTFFNDSILTLYGDTAVVIRTCRSPRFEDGQQPDTISIELRSGRVRAAPSQRTDAGSLRALRFEILTPDAVVEMGEGSYSVAVVGQETQVTTRIGLAQLTAGASTLVLTTGERGVTREGQPPAGPLPAEQNLVKNGDFSQPLQGTWEVYQVQPPSGVVTTTLRTVATGIQTALQLQSSGEDNAHSEIGIIQRINKSVLDYDSLRVQLDVRLNQQSLPGGGTLGSEFPLMVHLAYDDGEGNDRDWYHGFYYVPGPAEWILYDTPFNSSRRTVRYVWYPFESLNLLDSLGTAKPVYLKFIRLYGSGWLYDAYVTNVALLVQE
jgi:hypothetical protein